MRIQNKSKLPDQLPATQSTEQPAPIADAGATEKADGQNSDTDDDNVPPKIQPNTPAKPPKSKKSVIVSSSSRGSMSETADDYITAETQEEETVVEKVQVLWGKKVRWFIIF